MNFKPLFLSLVVFLLLVTLVDLASAATTIYAPAVDSNGKGILTPFTVTATQGTGRIRTDIQASLIATETENSIRTAAQAASKEASVSLENIDINIDIDSEAELIDGPSGGMAFGIAIYNELIHIAALRGQAIEAPQIRSDLVVTGAITEDGLSEKVGGVEEKVIAVSESGKKLMLIAAGQSANDALDYAVFAREISNGSLQVVEVHSLNEALQYAYTANNSRVDAPQVIIQPLVLERFIANEKTLHVKQIALDEIQTAQTELAKVTRKLDSDAQQSQQVTAIIRSVNESLKNAQQAVDNGYYYTGANSAFLARINLQTVNAEGTTTQDFQTMVSEMETQLTQFNTSVTATQNNFEDIAAAKMRYWWAYTRFNEAKEEFTNTKTATVPLVRDYYNAVAWFDASKKLMQHAKNNANGDAINEYNLREYSLDLLEKAEKIANTSTDSEIQWHLKTAKVEITNADYVTAVFDLQFVLSADSSTKQIVGKTPDQLIEQYGEVKTTNIYNQPTSATWAELYYANAIYNLQDVSSPNDLGGIINAVRLKELAMYFNEAKEQTLRELQNPRNATNRTITPLNALPQAPQEQPNVTATITQTTNSNTGTLQIIALIIVAIGIVILAGITLGKLKPINRHVNTEQMLDKLDEALVSGRISESTYKRLKAKYATKAKEEKIETKNLQTSKERLKRKRR
ncbi:MAG: S16 family serine protease [Candidatus Micrarchaeota archaeon]|nr:S16 family serine protease [Candidatus Micrarchaeota archaeon]